MGNFRGTSRYFITGLIAGVLLTGFVGAAKRDFLFKCFDKIEEFLSEHPIQFPQIRLWKTRLTENFDKPISVSNQARLGKEGFLTFEVFREGTFEIKGNGVAVQKSPSYRDSAYIRSTRPLPRTYRISVLVGEIDYGLEKIAGLPQDPEYREGPQNENGCYLLAITDEKPTGHHTNTWWHQHRKVVIDVDNNVWGHGMPNPVFMVYFDKNNNLHSWNARTDTWTNDWTQALTYDPKAWYKIVIEKRLSKIILNVYNRQNRLIKRSEVALKDIWNEDAFHRDYFVIGDPHENYYQGSMKIKEISLEY